MFKYRICSFVVLLALLGAIFFWQYGGLIFMPVAALVIALALYETGKLFNLCKIENDPVFTAELGGIVAFLIFLNLKFRCCTNLFILLLTGVFLAVLLLVWSTLLFTGKPEAFRKLFTSVALAALMGIPYILFACFYSFAPIFMLYVMLTVKAMDTGGYVFGMLSNKMMKNGNHKIAPTISPKKSWEGFFGGIFASILVSFIFYCFKAIEAAWYWYLVSAIVLALLSFAGDLTESALKRRAGVKDSANWIPGMGGVLDVVDSFLYVGPAVALIALIWFSFAG